MFVSLKNGLSDLVAALVQRLTDQGVMLKGGCAVDALRVRSHQLGRWMYDVILNDGSALSVDSLVLATPAYVSAELVRPLTPIAGGCWNDSLCLYGHDCDGLSACIGDPVRLKVSGLSSRGQKGATSSRRPGHRSSGHTALRRINCWCVVTSAESGERPFFNWMTRHWRRGSGQNWPVCAV